MTADASDVVWSVEEAPAEETRALRRFVLRRGTPTDNVTFDTDDRPGTLHFVIRDPDGAVIATSTWFESESPTAAGVRAVQLRAMAVHDDYQGRGLGAVLIDAGATHAASIGAELVWAKARDSALGFYTSEGFEVVGDGFLTEDTRIPHHLVVRHF